MLTIAVVILLTVGTAFFVVGTLGMLRLPDFFSRLHAVTKADTVGLGFITLGLCLLMGDAATALKLGFIWLLALVSASTVAQLISTQAVRDNTESGE